MAAKIHVHKFVMFFMKNRRLYELIGKNSRHFIIKIYEIKSCMIFTLISKILIIYLYLQY